jgi:GT2 family glycosyltransferase
MITIVLVNWNAPSHTLICLASLMRLIGPQPSIIVCDNDSRDDSYEILREALLAMRSPPRADWQPFHFWEAGATGEPGRPESVQSPEIALIRTSHNRGFAGGVNACLVHAMENPAMEYAWVLNNDTSVDADALLALLKVMEAQPHVGLCGSTLLYFDHPDRIQAVGGRYRPWLGITRHLLAHEPYRADICRSVDVNEFDYIVGGSLFFRRSALERVGLLAEDYFLFFEELDWVQRMRRQAPDLSLGYAPDSLVYHKEGASTGASDAVRNSYRYDTDYFYQTSRLRFARRYFPWHYPLVRLSLLGVALNRVRRRQWRSVVLALGLLVGWLPVTFKPDGGVNHP